MLVRCIFNVFATKLQSMPLRAAVSILLRNQRDISTFSHKQQLLTPININQDEITREET